MGVVLTLGYRNLNSSLATSCDHGVTLAKGEFLGSCSVRDVAGVASVYCHPGNLRQLFLEGDEKAGG